MTTLELAFYIAVLATSLLFVAILGRRGRYRTWPLLVVVGAPGLAGAVYWNPPSAGRWKPEPLLPTVANEGEFRGSGACRSCHPSQYSSWHSSYHRTMTQIASPAAIQAPFDGSVLSARGRRYRVYRFGDEFRVEMPDPDWEDALVRRGVDLNQVAQVPQVERQIVMATGSHHYQVYWVRSTRGRELRQFPWAYHLREQRWIPGEDVFIRPPDAPRRFALWNNNCIQCHAVAGNPGIDPGTNDLNSSVAEFGISCEACHGSGAKHIQHHRDPVSRYQQHLSDSADPTIVNPARLSAKGSSQVCGQCHSSFAPVNEKQWFREGYAYRAGGDLSVSHHELQRDDLHGHAFFGDAFWPDGTSRVGGREYTAMTESACFHGGNLSCLSCHSMHASDPNDQLARNRRGDDACLQCHSALADDVTAHTHHRAGSSGSRCDNCHMPHTTYALFKGIRSHRIDSPNATTSVRTGRPNACNLCHADKSLGWSADHLESWYGAAIPEMNEDQRNISASLLQLLQGDAVQRAVAAWNMGWEESRKASSDGWQAPFLSHLLNDPYSVVRFVAYDALRAFPGYDRLDYDFMASPAELGSAPHRALQLWKGAPHLRRDQSILINDDGSLDHDAVHRLLEKRDNRPIELPE